MQSADKKENCVFAGTFDPVTKGHENIIKKCLERFNLVIVAIGENKDKTPFFTLEERKRMLNAAFGENRRVIIAAYADYKEGYAEFLKRNGVTVYARGVRNEKDVAYENAYAEKNKTLYPFIKTVYVYPDKEFIDVSSTLAREKIEKKESCAGLLSSPVYNVVNDILTEKKRK